jgi:uncharacterized membrane protein YedE/YeeE
MSIKHMFLGLGPLICITACTPVMQLVPFNNTSGLIEVHFARKDERVLSFLDITGSWNPALAFTMGGAIAVAASAFWLIRKRGRALNGDAVNLPAKGRIDLALILGSVVFGIGWGLSGICPGPAVLLLFGAGVPAWIFGAAVALGMYAAPLWPNRNRG